MSVFLVKQKDGDGSVALRLDIYHKGVRQVETFKHFRLAQPSNLLDREKNKSRMQQAEEFPSQGRQFWKPVIITWPQIQVNTIVTVCIQSYINAYTKKDRRNMQGVQKRFVSFLNREQKD